MMDQVVHSGWLTKRGAVRKNWKRRWFVMTRDKKMHYYASKDAKDPLGYIDLDAVLSIFPSEKKGPRRYSISMNTAERQWVLCTDSAGNLEKWLKMLEVCVGVARRFVTAFEGYLGKKGKLNKSWRRRYFALGNQWLFYFENKEDCMSFKRIAFFSEKVFQHAFFKHVRGSIPLERATLARIPSSNVRMDVSTSNRTFHLEADSSEELEDWIEVILSVQEAARRATESAKAAQIHHRTPTAMMAPQLYIRQPPVGPTVTGFSTSAESHLLPPPAEGSVMEAFESDAEDTPSTSPRAVTPLSGSPPSTSSLAAAHLLLGGPGAPLKRSRSNLELELALGPNASLSKSRSRRKRTLSISLRRSRSPSRSLSRPPPPPVPSKSALREKLESIRVRAEREFAEEDDDFALVAAAANASHRASPNPPRTPREAAARAASHKASMVVDADEIRALAVGGGSGRPQRRRPSKGGGSFFSDVDELMPLRSEGGDGGDSSDSEAPEAALDDVSISPPMSMTRNEILLNTKRVSRIFSRKRKASLPAKPLKSTTYLIDVDHEIEVGAEILSESFIEDVDDDEEEYSDESDIEEGTLPSRFAGISAERYELLLTQEEQLVASRQLQAKRSQERIIVHNRRRFKTFYSDLSEGYRIVKHTLDRPPEERLVRIDRDANTFSWGHLGKKQQTLSMLDPDVRVVRGKYSPTLLIDKRISDEVCFAVVSPSQHLELEFQVKSPADRNFFVQLLRSLARSAARPEDRDRLLRV